MNPDTAPKAGHGAHWHHSPAHLLVERGAYMVTAGTYMKEHFFAGNERLRFLHDALLDTAAELGWGLQAWAVFPNHYHFVGVSPEKPDTLRVFIKILHGRTSREINKRDNTTGRQVWHQYWDTRLSYERSYYARLHYVHANAVHHGLVKNPALYPWCSAARFESEAPPAFQKMIYSFPIDKINVADVF